MNATDLTLWTLNAPELYEPVQVGHHAPQLVLFQPLEGLIYS